MNKAYKNRYLQAHDNYIHASVLAGFLFLICSALLFGLINKPEAECVIVEQEEVVEDLYANYTPSLNTEKIMNSHTGVTAKIHAYYGEDWLKWAELIARESGFEYDAINPTSGACGLAQALPCSKMACSLDYEGVECQLEWIETYSLNRYGSIDATLHHHNLYNWY